MNNLASFMISINCLPTTVQKPWLRLSVSLQKAFIYCYFQSFIDSGSGAITSANEAQNIEFTGLNFCVIPLIISWATKPPKKAQRGGK